MLPNQDNPGRLDSRDQELVALGAAIASNCIPCVEYHIPQARKAGLSDLEIREAVSLADKVRRVPARKVLQTASALLEIQDDKRAKGENDACASPDTARSAGLGAVRTTDEPRANDVRIDNRRPEEDNKDKKECCDDAEDSARTQDSGGAAAEPGNAENHAVFDFPTVMHMMRGCCPDKMKDVPSMMSSFEKGRCPADEDTGSKEPA